MNIIQNPILPGFHPDPSIVRVEENYYIATSTFEWFPGVQIHHSKDLVNWKLLSYPLTHKSQLNMIGNLNSGGVWAPCLTYDNGLFYLVFTDVKSRKGAFKDTHNYLTVSENIEGPWSEPIYLNSSGFDPSFFHDENGSKWLLNMLWDHRKNKNSFAGIVLQEFSMKEKKLTGPIKQIFKGTHLGLTEAPHIYKKNNFYYLVTAEGGTGYGHAVTIARSESLFGPYEVDPESPVLTSKEDNELQRAGHASLVETQNGEWYMAHLCSRPVVDNKSILGRETAIQKCYWTEDGWLRVEGGNEPKANVSAPDLKPFVFEQEDDYDSFESLNLKKYWNSLRRPFSESWITLKERPGYLRLKGEESMSSLHHQSLLARRIKDLHLEIETTIDFTPENFQQMAGLILYYDTEDYIYLRITCDEKREKCLGVLESRHGIYDELLDKEITLPNNSSYKLRATINNQWLQFSYSLEGEQWTLVGAKTDISNLSDEDADYIRFTGAFVGICAQDLSGQKRHADFKDFLYKKVKV